ncbi:MULTISPECIES: hypothetical protein [unclassified Ornithinimicrobium]|uniref:hypothetical protein n=1 Tax=unclassified Ornithinimicrobium TaxID=2615080 RepID=UPI003852499B
MSENTSDRRDDDDDTEGTFVGGGFGQPDEPATTMAEVLEHGESRALAGSTPAEVEESLEESHGDEVDVEGIDRVLATDVEGTGNDLAPGDLNEPV